MEKPIDHPFKDNFEMSENDDERANVVSFNLFLFNTGFNLYKLRKKSLDDLINTVDLTPLIHIRRLRIENWADTQRVTRLSKFFENARALSKSESKAHKSCWVVHFG